MNGVSQREFIGALGIYSAGGLFWAFLPFFVGLQVSAGGMSQAQAGSLGSAYLVGFSVASLTGLWWVSRFDWRISIGLAVAVIVAALYVLAGTTSYGVSLGSVLVIGLMKGAFWTLAYRIFGAADDPDRSFATGIVVAYTLLALVSFIVGKFVVPDYGLGGSAYLLMALIIVLGFSAFLVPAGAGGAAERSAEVSYRPPLRVALALFGILATGFAFAAVWAFAERIGVASGFDAIRISPVVASNLLASAAGSVLATILGTRFGRRRMLLAGMALMVGAILALSGAAAYWLYAVGVVGLGFTVGLVMPYQMAALAALDREGRFVVLITAAQGIGSAMGPVLGGAMVDTGGLDYLVITAAAVLVAGVMLFGVITSDEES